MTHPEPDHLVTIRFERWEAIHELDGRKVETQGEATWYPDEDRVELHGLRTQGIHVALNLVSRQRNGTERRQPVCPSCLSYLIVRGEDENGMETVMCPNPRGCMENAHHF